MMLAAQRSAVGSSTTWAKTVVDMNGAKLTYRSVNGPICAGDGSGAEASWHAQLDSK